MKEEWFDFIYSKPIVEYCKECGCSVYKIDSKVRSILKEKVVECVCSSRIKDCGITFDSDLLICKNCLCYDVCVKNNIKVVSGGLNVSNKWF